MSRTNKTRQINGMKNVNAYVDQTKLFVIISKNGIKINVDVTVKN